MTPSTLSAGNGPVFIPVIAETRTFSRLAELPGHIRKQVTQLGILHAGALDDPAVPKSFNLAGDGRVTCLRINGKEI